MKKHFIVLLILKALIIRKVLILVMILFLTTFINYFYIVSFV
jgi:hypothetical protein